MRQEKYLDKAISKLEKDLRKAGLSDMYTISGRIENRIPILDVSNNEIGSARTYNLANAYIMYLEEDVSAAESFKDTRREIMADVCRENPIEVQPEETFPMDSNVQPDLSVEDLDTPFNFNVFSYASAEANRIVNDVQRHSEVQERIEDAAQENFDSKEQEFRSFDTNDTNEFFNKIKEFFEWKSQDPLAGFCISAQSPHRFCNAYLINSYDILINLTDAYLVYQNNNQDFFDFATDLYAVYEEKLEQHRQQQSEIAFHSWEDEEEHEDTPLVIQEEDNLELEHEYYETQEETNMPDANVTNYDRMQEFDDYDTNYESEFAAKMKELFEWKEPETSFTLRSENGIHNLYVGETGIVINLTEANERYQTNSQSFLEIGLDLYNNDYKERLAEQIRENAGMHSGEETEEPTKEEQSTYDTEEYDEDYFPF